MSITPSRRCNQSWRPSASSASGGPDFPSSSAGCRLSCEPNHAIVGREAKKGLACHQSTRGKGPRESDETRHWDVLGPRGRLDPRCLKQRQRIRAERFQALAQHLAALTERGFSHLLEY